MSRIRGGIDYESFEEATEIATGRRGSRDIAELVRREFLRAWGAYKTYAWGYDYLKPISRTGANRLASSFLETPLVAMTTMYLMELDDEFENTVDYIANNLSFDRDIEVDFAHAVMTWLGPLVSTYQISGDQRLLKLAVDLADRLKPAYNTSTGLPYRNINLKTGATSGTHVNAAWITQPLVDFGTLSKLTGDNSYYSNAKNAANYMYSQRSSLDLVGLSMDCESGDWVNTEVRPSLTQAFHEDIIYGWHLLKDPDLLDWGSTVLKANFQHNFEVYNGMLWFKTVDMDTGDLVNRHITRYAQNWIRTLVEYGRVAEAEKFARSVYSFWSKWTFPSLRIDYSDMSIVDNGYDLNPEFAEGLLSLYSTTGNEDYRWRAYTMLQKLVKYCRYDVRYTGISDVTTLDRKDEMTQYFLSDTLKYLYLIFADSPRFNYDDFVFNTFAQPMKGVIPT